MNKQSKFKQMFLKELRSIGVPIKENNEYARIFKMLKIKPYSTIIAICDAKKDKIRYNGLNHFQYIVNQCDESIYLLTNDIESRQQENIDFINHTLKELKNI